MYSSGYIYIKKLPKMIMYFCLSLVLYISSSKEDISDVNLCILYPIYLIQQQTV